MFNSMNNSYPLYYNNQSQFSSTTPENNNISFQHYQDLYTNYLMPSNLIPLNSQNPMNTLLLQAQNDLENSLNHPFSSMNTQKSSKRGNNVKRETRHTKICTAQGVRDRRVRLSINIAREFFNLQDKLGFDKASKTLGWLLEKSKDSIEELTININKRNNETNLEARTTIEEKDDLNDVEQELNTKGSSKMCGKKNKKNDCVDQSNKKAVIRRVDRAKARERARERTKTKEMKNMNNNHHNNYIHLESSSTSIHHQNDPIDQQQRGLISGFTPNSLISHGINYKGVNVEKSIVVKSHSKETSSLNYNDDMITTKDYQVGYDNYRNDHLRKFEFEGLPSLNNVINNLSTGIHINSNSWDIYNNENLH